MKIPAQGWIAVCDHAAVLRPSTSDNRGLAPCSAASGEASSIIKRRADIIVLLLPLTSAAENLIDSHFLAGVRDGAALINVGRAALIVESALIAALNAGRLRHAVLDVFRTEPLPAEHAFWSHPKITITPHNSSATNPATTLGQIIDNIRRATTGEKILHPVDPVIGY